MRAIPEVGPRGAPCTLESAIGLPDARLDSAAYDESVTLNAHLADGRATEADLVAVGATIARFHAASGVEIDADSGGLAAVLEETLETLRGVG